LGPTENIFYYFIRWQAVGQATADFCSQPAEEGKKNINYGPLTGLRSRMLLLLLPMMRLLIIFCQATHPEWSDIHLMSLLIRLWLRVIFKVAPSWTWKQIKWCRSQLNRRNR